MYPIIKKIKLNLLARIYNISHSITIKIALLAWTLVISSIVITGFFNFFTQQEIILERMRIEASNVTESIIQAHATSLFTDNYEAVIDFCSKLVSSSSSIEFITLTKYDGNSLIFKRGSWSFQLLKGTWTKPNEFYEGKIGVSEILNKESFRFSKPFIYTGVNWGYVHLGISLDSYYEAMENLIWRTGIFSLSFIFIGFFIAVLFSNRLTKPIKELVKTTKEIEAGNLKAYAEIFSNDELGSLAQSFNSMTLAVSKSNDFLESTVEARTLELATANKNLTLHSNAMKQSLEEKEILLKEIHHRVKNNLQVISSLLYLQSKKITDKKILAIFTESQMRVRSLALVHEKLYQSSNLSRIDFGEYIKNFVSSIKSSYKISSKNISVILELDQIYLSVDKSVPLGLLLNELLSNAFKYAFPENSRIKKENVILIRFTTTEEGALLLMVSDNGVGIPDDFDLETINSLGLKIVTSLISQINGTLKIKNKNNTEFVVVFNS